MKTRKVLCMALGVVMVFSLLLTRPASAAYSDTAGHWAQSAIDRWSGFGVVRGSNGSFRPNGKLNRAEAATIMDNLLGLTETEGAQTFLDVSPDAWFADAMAKASAAGILQGVGGNRADPYGEVSRETFFVMFARGLGLSPQDDTRGMRSDGSAWSEGYINALTDKGYVRGDGTGIRALEPMTRAGVMSLLDQTVSTYVNEDGAEARASGEGITLVAAKNVTLNGQAGDVIVSAGASGGSLTIRDATVGEVNVAEGAKNVTVRAERTANIGTVNTRSAGTTVSGTGRIDKLVGAYTDRRTAPTSSGGSGSSTPTYVYALMNIPYGEFYAAEGAADAVSSATRNGKARNVNVNGASYHESADAVTTEGIAGVMYPVRATAAQLAALKNLGAVEVTDASEPVSYEMSARGQTTTVTLEGKDVLQESPRYSYYVLSGTPVSYKTLNVSGGTVSFGKAAGTPTTGETGGTVTVGGRHADIEISLSGIEIEPKEVSAVTVTTTDGATYALRHVVNIWRGTEIGWNLSDLDLGGKTITNVRYYRKDGTVTDYAVSLEVAKAGYVLMNIPYGEFYAGEGVEGVDAVTSATKMKPRTGTLAGGSYHVNADGSDITGVTYPVFVKDWSALEGLTQITDESSVDITVTNRGQETTTTYSGQDALFEAPSHAYYVLSEKPAYYKTLTVESGAFIFGAVSGRATTVQGASGEVTVGGRHADVEIKLTGTEGVNAGDKVSGVVLTDSEGTKYALRHVVNVWRGTEIGWNLSDLDLGGKTITNIRYYKQDAVMDYPVELSVAKAGYVLMNIPYGEFYAGEGVEGVDAVTSATKMKPRTGTLAGGSYHVNADGSDITGVTYPVFVKDWSALEGLTQITEESSVDITVTNRGQETTTTYSGQDALFEAPSHAYYVLSEKPAYYKTLTVESGAFTFGAVSGRATTVSDVQPGVVYHSHHNNFIEITLNGVTFSDTENVSGAIVTMESGKKLALRHITELWRKNCIGWADADGVAEETITNVTFLTQSGKYSCDVNIPIKKDYSGAVTAAFTAVNSVTISGLPEDVENPVATVKSQVGRGETPVVIAQNIPVTNGGVTTADAASGTTYTITVTSDNYADLSATAAYEET